MIYSRKANGNVAPSRFVKLDSSDDGLCLQADAGAVVFGVSQPGTRRTPYGSLDDGYAAIAGEDLLVYGPGEWPMLELAAACSNGERLKSDADGKGTPVTADKDEYGAVAQASGAAGELIPVLVVPYGSYNV